MIIISLTSWSKRINTVYKTIDSIMKQSLKPDFIEMNLSIEEFPNKEKDLPKILQEYSTNGLIEINWVEKNTRTFKKIIPTLQKFYGQDYYLLSIDDDYIYPENYIEWMIKEIAQRNGDTFCASKSKIIGNRTIYKSSCFTKDFWEKLTPEVIRYGIDDSYIEYYLLSKKKKLTTIGRVMPDLLKTHDETSPLHDEYLKNNKISLALDEIYKIKF